MENKEYLSVNQFAKMANVTTATVYNWIRNSINRQEGYIEYNSIRYSICIVAEKYCLLKTK